MANLAEPDNSMLLSLLKNIILWMHSPLWGVTFCITDHFSKILLETGKRQEAENLKGVNSYQREGSGRVCFVCEVI